MSTKKEEITPEEFDAIKAKMDDALRRRRVTILRQRNEGMTQQAIANCWGKDIALINRILKKAGEDENTKRPNRRA